MVGIYGGYVDVGCCWASFKANDGFEGILGWWMLCLRNMGLRKSCDVVVGVDVGLSGIGNIEGWCGVLYGGFV